MTAPAPITDHIDQALGKLIMRFQGKPRFAAWVAARVRQVQKLEDAIQVVIGSRDVDTCDETRLEIIGKIVGQPRRGTTLEQFRMYVKARIKVNRSRGRIRDLKQIATMLVGPVTYWEGAPAYFQIEASTPIDPVLSDPNVAAELLREAKAAGVGMGFVYNTSSASGWLVGSYTDDTDAARGGSYDGTTGGVGAAFA